MVDHPFEEGKRYQNHIGRYEVVAIEGAKMRIRYEDGREQIVGIKLQARIWENMQLHAAPAAGASRSPVRRRRARKEGAQRVKK